MTVKELKELLKDIPDDYEIHLWCGYEGAKEVTEETFDIRRKNKTVWIEE